MEGCGCIIRPAANAGTVQGISLTNPNPDWLIPLGFVWHALSLTPKLILQSWFLCHLQKHKSKHGLALYRSGSDLKILSLSSSLCSNIHSSYIFSRYLSLWILLKDLNKATAIAWLSVCLLYTSPSPRDGLLSRMPSSA